MKPIRAAIVGCGRISDFHQLDYRDRAAPVGCTVGVSGAAICVGSSKICRYGSRSTARRFELNEDGNDLLELLSIMP